MAKKDPAQEVSEFMAGLKHPLKPVMEELRKLILSADKTIEERFKWKAPSYHVNGTDFLTFNPRDLKKIHLVFHHPSIEEIESPLLEGDYKGRRMVYLPDAEAARKSAAELKRVIKKLISTF